MTVAEKAEKEKQEEYGKRRQDTQEDENEREVIRKGITLNDILDMIDVSTDLTWFDIIVARAHDRKRVLTEKEIEEGDVIVLSHKCNKILLSQSKGSEHVVHKVDNEGRYHITIGGVDTLLDREKMLLVRKGGK